MIGPSASKWWRTPLKGLLWVAAGMAGYLVMQSDMSDGSKLALFGFLGYLGLNYAINTLADRIEALHYRIGEIERRLPYQGDDYRL